MFLMRFTAPLGVALVLGACAGNSQESQRGTSADDGQFVATSASDTTRVVADTITIPESELVLDSLREPAARAQPADSDGAIDEPSPPKGR